MDGMTSMIGIIQALISVFIDDNDKLRCINAGRTRITFLMRTPLYYVCASSWGEPESVVRSHLTASDNTEKLPCRRGRTLSTSIFKSLALSLQPSCGAYLNVEPTLIYDGC